MAPERGWIKIRILVGRRTGEIQLIEVAQRECQACFPLFAVKDAELEIPAPINGLAARVSEYLPPLLFKPCHLLIDDSVVFSASLWQSKDSQGCVFIPWREGRATSANLWHFLHETFELSLKLEFSEKLPRWLIEGFAQYGAYFVMKREYPGYLPEVFEYYAQFPRATACDYFAWDYGSLKFDPKASDVFAEILKWSLGEHDSEKEHGCYRAALEAFVNVFGDRYTPRELIDLLREEEGVNWIRGELARFFE